MTFAAICDKCGMILPLAHDTFTIKYGNFALVGNDKKIDLCGECFEEFKRTYLENLEQEGGGE